MTEDRDRYVGEGEPANDPAPALAVLQRGDLFVLRKTMADGSFQEVELTAAEFLGLPETIEVVQGRMLLAAQQQHRSPDVIVVTRVDRATAVPDRLLTTIQVHLASTTGFRRVYALPRELALHLAQAILDASAKIGAAIHGQPKH